MVGQDNVVYGEFERRLALMGLPHEAMVSVMALVQTLGEDRAKDTGCGPVNGPGSRAAGSDLGVRIAQTFYKTALRATQALDTTSLSSIIMLVDLFVAYEQKRPISVSSLCIASGAAPTTALRQIGQLESSGFVTREGDTQDRRRSFVVPTARALDLIAGMIEEWRAVLRP